MTTVSEPSIDERPAKSYMGIRTQTPFKGMFAVVDQLRKELYVWFKAQDTDKTRWEIEVAIKLADEQP